MGTFTWQTWNSGPFRIERRPGQEPGTVILAFHGPFTLRDVYSSLPTMTLSRMLELETPSGEPPLARNILDLSACPYMDSSGVGMVVSHFVHCRRRGIAVIAACLAPRVREVFKLTRVDSIVPIAASLQEAETAPGSR